MTIDAIIAALPALTEPELSKLRIKLDEEIYRRTLERLRAEANHRLKTFEERQADSLDVRETRRDG